MLNIIKLLTFIISVYSKYVVPRSIHDLLLSQETRSINSINNELDCGKLDEWTLKYPNVLLFTRMYTREKHESLVDISRFSTGKSKLMSYCNLVRALVYFPTLCSPIHREQNCLVHIVIILSYSHFLNSVDLWDSLEENTISASSDRVFNVLNEPKSQTSSQACFTNVDCISKKNTTMNKYNFSGIFNNLDDKKLESCLMRLTNHTNWNTMLESQDHPWHFACSILDLMTHTKLAPGTHQTLTKAITYDLAWNSYSPIQLVTYTLGLTCSSVWSSVWPKYLIYWGKTLGISNWNESLVRCKPNRFVLDTLFNTPDTNIEQHYFAFDKKKEDCVISKYETNFDIFSQGIRNAYCSCLTSFKINGDSCIYNESTNSWETDISSETTSIFPKDTTIPQWHIDYFLSDKVIKEFKQHIIQYNKLQAVNLPSRTSVQTNAPLDMKTKHNIVTSRGSISNKVKGSDFVRNLADILYKEAGIPNAFAYNFIQYESAEGLENIDLTPVKIRKKGSVATLPEVDFVDQPKSVVDTPTDSSGKITSVPAQNGHAGQNPAATTEEKPPAKPFYKRTLFWVGLGLALFVLLLTLLMLCCFFCSGRKKKEKIELDLAVPQSNDGSSRVPSDRSSDIVSKKKKKRSKSKAKRKRGS